MSGPAHRVGRPEDRAGRPKGRPLQILLLILLPVIQWVAAAQQYPVKGMVVSVNRAGSTFTASIEEIPGFMRAMTMPFEVRQVKDLDGLAPGAIVEFTLVVEAKTSYAERIRIVKFQNVEQDPFAASRLALLNDIVSGTPVKPVAVGEVVPNFSLTDQRKRTVSLSELRGSVVALNFVYTNCALPNFCLRLANNFNVLQKRFEKRLGKDLVLLTVTFDPVHDTPEVLAKYSEQWKANPAAWHFLTGSEKDVQRVCRMFGVQAFPNEGLMDHSLHTVLIGRDGKLVANVEGNRFTASQLGDLTQGILDRK
jgi:protein SCO1